MSWPLGSRWRWFPGGPVCPDASRSEPLAVHRRYRGLGLGLLDKRHESVAFALHGLGVAYDPAVADLTERRECLFEGLRLDLRRQVADEYMMMVTGVQLRLISRARRPVNLHLLIQEGSLVHGGERRGRALVVRELDKRIRIVSRLPYDLASFHGTNLREKCAQKFLRHRGVQITHIERSGIAFVAHTRSSRLPPCLSLSLCILPYLAGILTVPRT